MSVGGQDEVGMSEDNTMSSPETGEAPERSNADRIAASVESRRKVLKTGAILLPAVLTLRATPAWAQTDYTVTAYRYGVGAGLCKNPNFNPNAAPGSMAGTEFVPCPTGNLSNQTPEPTAPLDDSTTRTFGR